MLIFWKKNCKNHLSIGGSAPEPLLASGGYPALSLPPTITTLLSSFLWLNAFYYPQTSAK